MLRLFSLFIALFSIPTISFAALFDGLPSEIKDALKDAYGTKNTYVIEAVTKYTKDKYPNYNDKTASYVTSIKAAEEKEKLTETKTKEKNRLSGNIDAGLQIANGNTKTQDFNSSSKINYAGDGWSNTLNITTRSGKESRVRTNEEYIVNNQTKYDLSEKYYSYLELEYVNDRFSGYDYRVSQLMGVGYKLHKSDILNITAEAGSGSRQSKLSDNTKETSMLGKLGVKADWKINDTMTLNQDLNSSFGSESVITTWDTSIKTKLSESIYLKFNYNLQHIDDVPVGKKHIDSFTSIGVGYEF